MLADLLAWRDGQVPRPELLFWRTTTEGEVDFVIELGQRLLAVEIKASAQPSHGDTLGLRLFREEYGERCVGGLLLHGGSDTPWLGEDILAAPWWRVLCAVKGLARAT